METMRLIEQVKNANDESFESWFDRWYGKQHLDKKIIQSAQKGYSGFVLTITDYNESNNNFSKERQYVNRRLRDDRTLEKIREKLGDGFDVVYKKDVQKSRILNVEVNRDSDWIEIRLSLIHI